MRESFQQAKEELKRADHLMFVSLKYTRTVDVIKSIIERLISCLDFTITVLLKHAKDQKKLVEVPSLARLKIDACRSVYGGDVLIMAYLDFHLLLRRIDKARFESAQEYRRHVTMTAHLEEGSIEVSIDIIQDYYTRTKEFLAYVSKLIDGEHSQE